MHTPDQAFVEEILEHGRKQLEKGWTPLSTAGNLRARFGLTEDCGKRIVGVLMASRFGPSVDQLAAELATSLELSMEEATARVVEVRKGFVDPDDWSSIILEFDPERTSYYAPAPATPAEHQASPEASAATSQPDDAPRLRGPIRLEVNLLPDEEERERRKRGLFRGRS